MRRSEPRGSKELGTHPEVPQKTAPLQHGDMEAQARQPTPLLPRQCRPRVCGNWAVFCRLHGPPVCGATGQGSQPLLQALVFATRPPPPPVPCGFERSLSQGTSGSDEACHSAPLLRAAPRGGPEAGGGHGFRPGPARHLGSLPAQGHRHRKRHRLGAPAGNGARSAPRGRVSLGLTGVVGSQPGTGELGLAVAGQHEPTRTPVPATLPPPRPHPPPPTPSENSVARIPPRWAFVLRRRASGQAG